ncbi:hypothetical protein C7B67_07740 [filamentous cyanobacterium Phorm 6]|nr:hypothetical protein C7B67_07740 [filamentous cyanobacterium Phorm 6]
MPLAFGKELTGEDAKLLVARGCDALADRGATSASGAIYAVESTRYTRPTGDFYYFCLVALSSRIGRNDARCLLA